MASTSKTKLVRKTKKFDFKISDSDLNVELIKEEFDEKLLAHFLFTKDAKEFNQFSNLRSRQCLEKLVQNLKKEENSGHNIIRDKYKIVETNNLKKRLFYNHDGDKFKVVLPWEDIFEIYWQAHIRYKHLKGKELKTYLENNYIVNNFAIKTITEVCYICSGEEKPYYRCTLDLLTMGGRTDFAFSHIMSYQDMCTGFIHLRPLSVDNRDSEICVELLRIFMDFGPPKIVFASHDIFLKALDQFEHLTKFALSKPIKISRVNPKLEKLTELRNKVSVWMAKNDFQNWGIALYGVQLWLNKDIEHGQKSPYDKVFKKISTCDIGDLDEVELDNFQRSSGVKVNKGVSTESPLDFVAMSSSSRAGQVKPVSPSSVESRGTEAAYTGIETEFSAPSDDEIVQFEAEDPLAIDSSSS